MSTETRTIRPYGGLSELEKALSRSVLHFGGDTCPTDSSIAVTIDPHTFLLRSVVIEWAPEDAFDDFIKSLQSGADSAGIDRTDLSLHVFAKSSYLKLVDHLYTRKLSDLEGMARYVELSGRRPNALRTPRSGFSIEAFVILDRFLDPAPMRPWRKGTWLARAAFGVSTTLGRNLYRPLPLTDEVRNRLGLPAKTVRFVDLDDHDPLDSFATQPTQPILYIDEELLAELNASRLTATNKAMQYDMALDFLATVVYQTSRRSDELKEKSLADLEGTLLGEIIRRIGGPAKKDQQTILSLLRSDPQKVIAHTEAVIDLRRPLIDSLKGPDV